MNETVHTLQSSFPGCLQTQHDKDLHLVPAFNNLLSYLSWLKMCVIHRNKTLDSKAHFLHKNWMPQQIPQNLDYTYNTSISQTGTELFFMLMLCHKGFISSLVIMHSTSAELAIGKHYSPGPQSRPLNATLLPRV